MHTNTNIDFPGAWLDNEKPYLFVIKGASKQGQAYPSKYRFFLPICVCAYLSEDQSEFEIDGVRPLCGYFRLVLPVQHTFKVLSEVIGFRIELHLG